MDVLLDRLEELAGGAEASPASPRRLERLTEALMLWRTLEVLVASFNPRELGANDSAFAKLLLCAREAVDNAGGWSFPPGLRPPTQISGEDHASVYVFAVRVVAKLAAKGERERQAVVSGDITAAIARSLQPPAPLRQDALAVASAFNALARIARDDKLRGALVEAVAVGLELMQLHPRDAAVQLSCCSFLQQMMQEPSAKDRIPRAAGISAVLHTLRSFPNEMLLATTGLDLLSALCTHSGWSSPSGQGLEKQIQEITATLVTIVAIHKRAVQMAEAGVKLLNSLVLVHPSVRCALVESGVWELAEVALEISSDEAARGLADILSALVTDQRCMDAMSEGRQTDQRDQARRQCLRERLSGSSPARPKSRDLRGETLVRALLSATNEMDSDYALNAARSETRLFRPPDDGDRAPHTPSELTAPVDSDDDECPIADGSRHRPSHIVSPHEPNVIPGSLSSADSTSLIPTLENLGFYEQFMSEAEAITQAPATIAIDTSPRVPEKAPSSQAETPKSSPETSVPSPVSSSAFSSIRRIDDKLFSTRELQRRIISDASTSTQWQDRCESVSKDHERLLASHNALKDNFRILERRANEQTNLLSIQSSRLQHQSQMHQQVLDRMRTLASELVSMKKQYQVEHELRLAEATQSERISLTLHEATQEIKVLSTQRNSASRELLEKEKLRMDYQTRATENKQVKQRLEIERDEAIIALQVMKQEKAALLRQLDECRREGRESLGMREEDVDARKPRVFSEVLLRPGSAPLSSNRRGALTVSPRSSPKHVSAVGILKAEERQTATGLSSPTQLSASTLETLASADWADPSDPKRIDRDEIERCLQSVYELLDASAEGDGVHIATVRRFFLESGLAQPPSVAAADVDMILAKVLAQSNENLKKTLVRKDYTLSQAPQPSARVDVRKYRFFDQAAFNEAVTIVGMKRFPRLDLLRVLQNVVSLYLLPYRRQFRTRSVCANTPAPANNNAAGTTLHRSMSMCLSPSSGGVQSSGCASVVRAILSGLALHIGRGNDHQQLAFAGDTSEIRYHSSNNNNNNRSTGSGGVVAKRKREDVVYSMLEMHGVLSREQKPLVAIFEFYGSLHHAPVPKDELFGLGFELVLNFAMDFEVIPSFMDRVSLKHLYSEVAGFVKTYFALQKKVPFAADTETLKKSAFLLVLARVAIELFAAKVEFETPERQISALLQWIDNSVGREKILRKASLPIVIKFSRRLYAPNS